MAKTSKQSQTKASKSSKLKELHQTHGKQEDFIPTTLDQVWGDDGMTKYGTKSIEDYLETLADMNKVELMEEARRVGTIPTDNMSEVHRRLVAEFHRYTGQYAPSEHKAVANKPHKNDKEVEKILREGR